MSEQIETQNQPAESVVTVGIDDFRTKISLNNNMVFIPKISLHINTKNRGIHMSRLIEAITESIEFISSQKQYSIEDFCKTVHSVLKRKHPFDYFFMKLSTELAIKEITPESKRDTIEVHDISYNLISNSRNLQKILSVKVIGSSCCPHALINNSDSRSHVQRSQILLSWNPYSIFDETSFEDLISICNKSFSSPVYSLLKTEDEQHVVNEIFEHPYFVEDITRNVVAKSYDLHFGKLTIEVTNFESIHRHNVVASKVIEFKY